MLLGATAGKAVFGPSFRVTQSRGMPLDWPDIPELTLASEQPPVALATIHPSAVLRAGDARAEAYAGLVADLRVAAGVLS